MMIVDGVDGEEDNDGGGNDYVRAIYQTLPFCSFFQKVPFDMDFI